MVVKGLGKLVPVYRNLQTFSETSFASETEILIATQEIEGFFGDAADELDRVQGCVTSDESKDIMQGAGFGNRAEAWSKVVGRWDLLVRYILQIPHSQKVHIELRRC